MHRIISSLRYKYRLFRIHDLRLYEHPYHRPLDNLEDRLEIWRRIIFDRRLRNIYDQVIESIDRARYRALQDKYRNPIEAGEFGGTAKYLDLAPWFRLHSKIALELDLDDRPPCRILDLGSGGGHFLAIAKSYGHQVTALDLPDCEIYTDLLSLFSVPRIEGGVYSESALPAGTGKHDIITINGQVFDVHRNSGQRWDVGDWTNFLEYLTTHHLDYPGEIFVGLNKSAGPTGTEDYLWPLIEFAQQNGAQVIAGKPQLHFSLQEPLSFRSDPLRRSRSAL